MRKHKRQSVQSVVTLNDAKLTGVSLHSKASAEGENNLILYFDEGIQVIKDNEAQRTGKAKITFQKVIVEDLEIHYFTDTTPHQDVSLSQLSIDTKQLNIEIIEELFNANHTLLQAQILRPKKPLYMDISIYHEGEVEYEWHK